MSRRLELREAKAALLAVTDAFAADPTEYVNGRPTDTYQRYRELRRRIALLEEAQSLDIELNGNAT